MSDEKDKQRRTSKAAHKMRERYKHYKIVDEIAAREKLRQDRENEILREFRPSLFAEDNFWLDVFRSIQRKHEPEISSWAQTFLDYHPVDQQRSADAIERWSDHVDWPVDEYGREFAALAVRLAITLQIEDLAKRGRRGDLMQASHERVVAARRRAAVYDGDLTRAREGYHVGPGWHAILDDLVQEFSEIEDLGFLAGHEKWGGLRVSYLYSGTRQADVANIEKRAADRSLVTCWYCGQPGQLRKERWWRVRCDEHWSAE